jgi:hypothetical protein
MRFRQPDPTYRYQPAYSGQQYSQREQIYEGALLPDGDGGSQIDEPGGKIHPGHETVNVVQGRRCVGLSPEKLQNATRHGDQRNEEQADPHHDLACEQRIVFDGRLLT